MSISSFDEHIILIWNIDNWASQVVLVVKNPPANAEDIRDTGSMPRLGRLSEEGHSNPLGILTWRIPWTEEPGRLQSTGSQGTGHD